MHQFRLHNVSVKENVTITILQVSSMALKGNNNKIKGDKTITSIFPFYNG